MHCIRPGCRIVWASPGRRHVAPPSLSETTRSRLNTIWGVGAVLSGCRLSQLADDADGKMPLDNREHIVYNIGTYSIQYIVKLHTIPRTGRFGDMGKDTLTESIREKLVAKIIVGELIRGDHIVEADMAREFGVSRTIVRDAMQALMTHGLLVRRPNQGCFVARSGALDISRALEAREAIEGMAARLMALNHSPDDIAGLRDLDSTMAAAALNEDHFRYRALHFEFHRYILIGSGNEYIADYSGAEPMLLKCLINYPPGFLTPALHLHREIPHADIANAIETGDPDAAEVAMRGHMRHTRERLLRWFENNVAGRRVVSA